MIVIYNGKSYRVIGELVEVRIKEGEPRVMQLKPRSASWRSINPNGKIAKRVRMRAGYLKEGLQ